MELTEEIRNRLRTAIRAKGETGYTINAKTGISATTIGNYINIDSKIKKADNTKLKVICNLLDIDLDWLETGDTNLVKCPEAEILQEASETEITTEDLLKQILLKISSKDDQFGHIYKAMNSNHNDVLKRIDKLEKKLENLQKEIEKENKE